MPDCDEECNYEIGVLHCKQSAPLQMLIVCAPSSITHYCTLKQLKISQLLFYNNN